MTNRSIQTMIILGMAIAAIIGALVGTVFSLSITGFFQADRLFSTSAETITLSQDDVDAKIVELIEEESATISVVKSVAPSVVSIIIEKRRGDVYLFDDYDFELFNPYYEPVYTEEDANEMIEVGGGTGFFVTSDGYIVTNHHVVSDEDANYSIATNDGQRIEAEVVAVDPYHDIAILDIEGSGYPVASLGDSDRVQAGQTVIAIGYSLSEFENTVTKGVVSGLNRTVIAQDYTGYESAIENAIQTDAAINLGNSGGPLINLLGEVVGVNTAISYDGQSIGFAIPINDVLRVVEDVKTYGRVMRSWIGVQYAIVTESTADQYGLSYGYGALVIEGSAGISVYKDSPADEAGLLEGDLILAVDDFYITEETPLGEIIYFYLPGDTVTLTVVRDGQEFTVNVLLEEYPTSL